MLVAINNKVQKNFMFVSPEVTVVDAIYLWLIKLICIDNLDIRDKQVLLVLVCYLSDATIIFYITILVVRQNQDSQNYAIFHFREGSSLRLRWH